MAHTHTHTRLTALFPGLPGWAGTRKVKPIWILLKQETVSGSGISWAICKSAPRSRQITTPAPHHSVFTGRMPFLPPNQQCQSTEGKRRMAHFTIISKLTSHFSRRIREITFSELLFPANDVAGNVAVGRSERKRSLARCSRMRSRRVNDSFPD